MNYFIDTCSLLKLYHPESGTENLNLLLSTSDFDGIFLSEITKTEFTSAIWKKIRMGEAEQSLGEKAIQNFLNDEYKFGWIVMNKELIDMSVLMIQKFGGFGLRTLDAIQLASAQIAIQQHNSNMTCITSDKTLFKIMADFGLITKFL